MQKIVSLLSACLLSVSLWAVKASPELLKIRQADGSEIALRLIGDEFHHYYTLEDGTPVSLNKAGMWVPDASVVSEPAAVRKARRIAQQQYIAGTFPLKGSPRSVVILVNFKDIQFQYSREEFANMLNVSGYSENNAIGSARDYFIACSDSVFQPIFDCYGPVTLSQTCSYYGNNTANSTQAHAGQMIVEACNLVADQLGVDFAQYDTDNDGNIDNVFVYYAGHNEAEGGGAETVWPHRSIITSGEKVSGKRINDYACTSELRGSAGKSMCGIGTFCHEFGHVLGLPDYYDTDKDQYTVGAWDIMCSGSYNGQGKMPPVYTSGERFQLGWLTPIQLKDPGLYTLEPLETSNKAYLIAVGDHNLSWSEADPSEYWLLENRQHVGWDETPSTLPSTGMLIWHISYNAAAWGSNRPNNGTPQYYDLVEAGGVKGYAASSDPFPGSKNVTSYTPMLHSGELVEQPLMDITQDELNITFTFKSNGEDKFMVLPTILPILESTYNSDNKKSYTPAQKVRLAGSHLDPEIPVSVSMSGSGFHISKDSASWNTSMELNAEADSTLDIDLFVRYAPNKQVCDLTQGRMTIRQENAVATYALRGISPRPVLIETPATSIIKEVTPTSFKIHWVPQKDAEQYFVTLYHFEPGTESRMESFENFDDEDAVQAANWYTSFYRTTTKAKEDGAMSMWFKENNEYMISPIYPMPVVGLSMWVNAPATTDTEVGWIILSGIGEAEGEVVLDTIKVGKSTKKYTYSISLDANRGIRRFRMDYMSMGGEGTCIDAFTTTFNEKTIYTYKDRERAIPAEDGDKAEEYAVFYGYDLLPNTTYYVQLQSAENKGCKENVSELSMPVAITTKNGEGTESKHLTLDIDSIYYDPAAHVVYLPQSMEVGSVNIYSAEGQLVMSLPVAPTQNVVVLPDNTLRRGAVYLLKYMPSGKMKRKNPWVKILYQ